MALTGKTIGQLTKYTSTLTGNELFPLEYNGATYHVSQSQFSLNSFQIATGSITASVNTDISASFRLTSGSNTLLNVTRDGFVWIGNGSFTNQAYQLDVQGTSRFTGETLIESNLSITGPGSTRLFSISSYATTIRVVASTSLGYFDFSKGFGYSQISSINEVIRYIAPSHLFGGTTYVASALVNLESATQGLLPTRTNSTASITNPAQGLLTYITASGDVEGLWQYRTGSNGWVQFLHNSSSIPASSIVGLNLSQIATGSVTASVNASSNIFNIISGSNTLVVVNNTGSVGIGITSPAYKLDVNGTARVSGDVRLEGTTFHYIFKSGNYDQFIYGNSYIFRTIDSALSLSYQISYINKMIVHNNGVAIGSEATAPVGLTAALEIQSTTQGFLPPRMTTTQRNAISSPATGLTIYNTTTLAPNTYNGTAWVGAVADNIYTADGTLTGNRTVNLGGYKLNIGDSSGEIRIANTSTASIGNSGNLMIGNPANNGALSFALSTIYFNGANGYHFTIATGLNDVTPSTFFQVRNSGNVLINSTSDTGLYKLDVNGAARVSGAMTIANGHLSIDGGSGHVIFLNGQSSNSYISFDVAIIRVAIRVGGFDRIYASVNYSSISGFNTYISSNSRKNIFDVTCDDFSGNNNLNDFTTAFSGQLGTNTFNQIALNPTGSPFSGTPNYRGVYINPLQTGFGFIRAIESAVGGAYFNTTSVAASAILQADSTTQGFLPPRMTNAQRTAISTPAVGLMVYCTDATEGLYVYKSTGWTFIV